MGERLGVLESLMREGISPIRTEEGIEILNRVLADPAAPTAMVVMGRAEGLPTITLEQQELPLLRFLDRTQVHYPGIELVADADLSASGDLYLADHLLDGDLLFPAVLGMEAMAQAATALTGNERPPVLTDVEFLRPIVVPVDGQTTIRIAALVTDDGDVEAVIRSSDTGFQADHFRATLRYSTSLPETVGSGCPARSCCRWTRAGPVRSGAVPGRPVPAVAGLPAAGRHQLHGPDPQPGHGGLVRRLPRPGPGAGRPRHPGRPDAHHPVLRAGRDAAAGRHRAAVPGRPAQRAGDSETVILHAVERHRDGDTYLYDLDVRDPAGKLVERWEGLRLQAVRKQDGTGPWLASLLGPYLERRTEPNLGGIGLRCAVMPDGDAPGPRPGSPPGADRQGAQLGAGRADHGALPAGRQARGRRRRRGLVLALGRADLRGRRRSPAGRL